MDFYNSLNHPIIFTQPQHLDLDVTSWIEHIPFAFYLVSALNPKTIVELGVHSGNSYNAFCQVVAMLKIDTQCFGVDTWKGDEHAGNYGESVYQDMLTYQSENYKSFSQLLRMYFDDALDYFSNESIDLLHIDGLHTYEAVLHDFETWLPKLSDRGVVLFHDTHVREKNFGVWKLWEELSDIYPGFSFGHGHGLGVLFVGKNVPSELIKVWESEKDQINLKMLFASLGNRIFERVDKKKVQLQLLLQEQKTQEKDKQLQSKEQTIQEKEQTIQEKEQTIQEKEQMIQEKEQTIQKKEQSIQEKEQTIQKKEQSIQEKEQSIQEKEQTIQEKEQTIQKKEQTIQEKEQTIQKKEQSIQVRDKSIQEKEQTIQEIRSSISFRLGWGLTAPLRWIYDQFIK